MWCILDYACFTKPSMEKQPQAVHCRSLMRSADSTRAGPGEATGDPKTLMEVGVCTDAECLARDRAAATSDLVIRMSWFRSMVSRVAFVSVPLASACITSLRDSSPSPFKSISFQMSCTSSQVKGISGEGYGAWSTRAIAGGCPVALRTWNTKSACGAKACTERGTSSADLLSNSSGTARPVSIAREAARWRTSSMLVVTLMIMIRTPGKSCRNLLK
mmetsp:Transcript_140992/g.351606  ORF Transcript_140992/g.351606 Transcript_140992/m.351606 type:complete len:217 (+) Transcript_140992:227-877(+)